MPWPKTFWGAAAVSPNPNGGDTNVILSQLETSGPGGSYWVAFTAFRESSQFYSLRLPRTIQQFGFLVAKRSKDQATSELEIAFDRAISKNGTEIPLALGIQAIGRSQASAAAMADDLPATSSTGAMGSSVRVRRAVGC